MSVINSNDGDKNWIETNNRSVNVLNFESCLTVRCFMNRGLLFTRVAEICTGDFKT